MTSLNPNPIRSYDTSNFSDESYQAVGPALSNNVVVVKIYNGSNQGLWVSWDGSTDHEYIESGRSDVIISNSSVNPISSGTQFYTRGYPGTGNSGSLYISTYYNSLL